MSCQGPERPFLEHRAFLHHARGDRVRTPPVGRGARVTVRNEAQQELHQAPQVKVTKEKDQNQLVVTFAWRKDQAICL